MFKGSRSWRQGWGNGSCRDPLTLSYCCFQRSHICFQHLGKFTWPFNGNKRDPRAYIWTRRCNLLLVLHFSWFGWDIIYANQSTCFGKKRRKNGSSGRKDKTRTEQSKTHKAFFSFGCSHLGLNVFRNNESHTKNILLLLLSPRHVRGQVTWSALILIFVGTVCAWIICSPDVATTVKSLWAHTRGQQMALLWNPGQASSLPLPLSIKSFKKIIEDIRDQLAKYKNWFKGEENQLSMIYTFSLLLNLHLHSLKSLEMFPISFQIQIERRTVQKHMFRDQMNECWMDVMGLTLSNAGSMFSIRTEIHYE